MAGSAVYLLPLNTLTRASTFMCHKQVSQFCLGLALALPPNLLRPDAAVPAMPCIAHMACCRPSNRAVKGRQPTLVTWLLAQAMAFVELKKPSLVLTPAQLMYWHEKPNPTPSECQTVGNARCGTCRMPDRLGTVIEQQCQPISYHAYQRVLEGKIAVKSKCKEVHIPKAVVVVPVVAQRHHDLDAKAPCLGNSIVQAPENVFSKDACRRSHSFAQHVGLSHTHIHIITKQRRMTVRPAQQVASPFSQQWCAIILEQWCANGFGSPKSISRSFSCCTWAALQRLAIPLAAAGKDAGGREPVVNGHPVALCDGVILAVQRSRAAALHLAACQHEVVVPALQGGVRHRDPDAVNPDRQCCGLFLWGRTGSLSRSKRLAYAHVHHSRYVSVHVICRDLSCLSS